MPIANPDSEEAERPPRPPLRVLIVDDSEDNRESLALLLRVWGHQALTAHDGTSALQACRVFCPDAVLMDLLLPGMTGWELARQVREQEGRQPPLLVALSGLGGDGDKARCLEAGFAAHLTKPVDLGLLERLLAEANPRLDPLTNPEALT